MSDFSFLKKFKVLSEKATNDLENIFYPTSLEEIGQVENLLGNRLPVELKEFYIQIGYGFMHRQEKDVNRFMDVYSFSKINLKSDYYEFDPDLELYDEIYQGDKFLFLEVNEGIYLAIDKKEFKGQNAIYYLDEKITDSLEEFLKKFVSNPNLIKEIS